MTGNSSEDDYMSDKFLMAKTTDISKKDNKRVTVHKRHADHTRTPKYQTISRLKQMEITREIGLNTKISQENIGFKLMMKMGFNPEGGLGKNSEGRADPIPIEVFDKQVGLGLHNMRQKRARAVRFSKQRQEENMQTCQSDFREAMASRFRMERVQRQLTKARSICQELDLAKNVFEPNRPDFWPPDEVTAQVLAQSTVIRREVCRSESRPSHTKHRRDAPSESEFNCEEKTETCVYQAEYDSVLDRESDVDDELCDIDAAQHGTIEKDPDVILLGISHYLREFHCYCFWCGAGFTDLTDLQSHCPGPLEEDHC